MNSIKITCLALYTALCLSGCTDLEERANSLLNEAYNAAQNASSLSYTDPGYAQGVITTLDLIIRNGRLINEKFPHTRAASKLKNEKNLFFNSSFSEIQTTHRSRLSEILFFTLQEKNHQSAIYALEHGADPNTVIQGTPAIFHAIRNHNLEVIEIFKHAGFSAETRNATGTNILILAAVVGDSKIFDYIADNFEIDPNATADDGVNLAVYACASGNPDILKSTLQIIDPQQLYTYSSFGIPYVCKDNPGKRLLKKYYATELEEELKDLFQKYANVRAKFGSTLIHTKVNIFVAENYIELKNNAFKQFSTGKTQAWDETLRIKHDSKIQIDFENSLSVPYINVQVTCSKDEQCMSVKKTAYHNWSQVSSEAIRLNRSDDRWEELVAKILSLREAKSHL